MPTSAREGIAASDQVVQDSRTGFDIVCFSHLRWDFVFQRPQHLLTRAARSGRVFYFEEPLFESVLEPVMQARTVDGGVIVIQPVLPEGLQTKHDAVRIIEQAQHDLVHEFLEKWRIDHFVCWYYTPMALAFTADLEPEAIVYDCMDELSMFRGAPPELLNYERELLRRANVVFAGGSSLYESKKHRHPNVHLFASSVDVAHFAKSRVSQPDPEDQRHIPHPRIGFYGVLDERLDLELLREVAELESGMHFVVLGPLAKIKEQDLPKASNIHYLGSKSYTELPEYLAGWDVAMLPFALNESTRFISPTKTPEYLAAHRPVVSTPIYDVITPYGDKRLVTIANGAPSFAIALEAALLPATPEWLLAVDTMLATNSWQQTWEGMQGAINAVLSRSVKAA